MKKVLAVACVVLLLGADKKDDTKKDADKLQGKWVLKSAERGGKEVDLDKEEHIPRSLVFKGDKVIAPGKDGEESMPFKVGREDKLGTLDITHENDKKETREFKCLYKLDGDTLTVCVNEAKSSERPKEIAAKEGSHCVVAVFKREKKKE
jgi:uncharacterized protein (TIGR03067 family)